MNLKDKITRRMRSDAITAALAGLAMAATAVSGIMASSIIFALIYGAVALLAANTAGGAVIHYLQCRAILRGPLFYLLAVRHDLGVDDGWQ